MFLILTNTEYALYAVNNARHRDHAKLRRETWTAKERLLPLYRLTLAPCTHYQHFQDSAYNININLWPVTYLYAANASNSGYIDNK